MFKLSNQMSSYQWKTEEQHYYWIYHQELKHTNFGTSDILAPVNEEGEIKTYIVWTLCSILSTNPLDDYFKKEKEKKKT